ncbi:response regulator transcription factor [Acidaminobacter sp. JC074]|uniref:LuxR C-terminal-related transcriptional regulator n=1 Tax=Acidaminobacter sp. JC074 TaxID=2530199 RepID=UPI001F0D5065|nr:response regulator transcription factor [Acidaminobacter sp. JC074]MCH4890310.1 response regulator transcription factor [Acidaminobacter sp. JC074]
MKCLIVEDHPLVAEGVKMILQTAFEAHNVVSVNSLREAELESQLNHYDLAIVDLCLKGKRSFSFIGKVIDERSVDKVLVFTSSIRQDYFERVMALNVDGYLVKECIPEDLVYAIKTIKSGRQYIDPIFYNIQKTKQMTQTSDRLTEREKEILRLVGEGLSNKAISEKTFISVNTVKKHITNIFMKMEFSNRNQAILYCQSNYV